jgi:hypothetical protein
MGKRERDGVDAEDVVASEAPQQGTKVRPPLLVLLLLLLLLWNCCCCSSFVSPAATFQLHFLCL